MAKKKRSKRVWNAKSAVIAALRKASRYMPSKTEALKRMRAPYGQFFCEECGGAFPRTLVQVDHINPVVPTSGWVSWDSYIERLFCSATGLAVLCKPCHKLKTQSENQERRKAA